MHVQSDVLTFWLKRKINIQGIQFFHASGSVGYQRSSEAMATTEQIKDMMNQLRALHLEVHQLKQANQILMKIQAMGADGGERGRKCLIDVKELAGMETLEHEKQWADWSTRFKDAIMACGHPAARCALDAMGQMAEKDA